jgi:hypothetical protein
MECWKRSLVLQGWDLSGFELRMVGYRFPELEHKA